MSRRACLDLLRPGCPCPVPAAAPAYPQRLVTRRTYGMQYALVVTQRAAAPCAVFPPERWWTGHPS